jgi:hypothetical protein
LIEPDQWNHWNLSIVACYDARGATRASPRRWSIG